MSRIDMLFDLRFGLRLFRRTPGFAIAAIVTLALGVGVNVALFSIVRAVLIRDLPYPDAARVVGVTPRIEQALSHSLTYDDLLAIRGGAPTLDRVSGAVSARATVRGDGAAESVAINRVLPDYFEVFGVAPAIGRTFGGADFDAGPRAAVISDALWRSQFTARADVIGRTVRVDRAPLTVIGVMPAWFDRYAGTPEAIGVWLPLTPRTGDALSVSVIARIAPGANLDTARAQVESVMLPRQPAYLEIGGRRFRVEGVSLAAIDASEIARVRPGLLMLQSLAGFLLLATCANLANVFFAHGVARRREIGVRLAIGSGRARLIRQLLVEAAIVASIGGAMGVALAAGTVPAMVALAGEILPRGSSVAVSPLELAVGVALAWTTAFVFAGLPAWLASAADPVEAMRGATHATAARDVRMFRAGLVAVQVVFALVVLTAATVLIRSFARVAALPLGFNARGLVTGELTLPSMSESWRDDARAFTRRLVDELGRRVGAVPITLASGMPYTRSVSTRTWVYEPADGSAAIAATAETRAVAFNYFEVLGIRVVRGRGFGSADVFGADPVAVVNESFARQFGQGRDVIGSRLGVTAPGWPVVTIVGVVADTRQFAPAMPPVSAAYTVLEQWPPTRLAIAIRGASMPTATTAMLDAVRAIDPEIPVTGIDSIDRKMADRERRRRFYLLVLSVFAMLAGTLTSVGIYGVVAHVSGQRRREMGVRLALGASPRAIARMIVGGGLRPVWLGVGLGTAASWWVGRALQANSEFRSQLYEISAQDPATIAGVVTVLVAVATFACWVPARRAAATNVVEALRMD